MTAAAEQPEFHLGDRLAKALDVSGIGVAEMAMRLGVSRKTIGNYLAGRTAPKLAALRIWSEETGIDLDWLRGTNHPRSAGNPLQSVLSAA